jgi:hypothetical protein
MARRGSLYASLPRMRSTPAGGECEDGESGVYVYNPGGEPILRGDIANPPYPAGLLNQEVYGETDVYGRRPAR